VRGHADRSGSDYCGEPHSGQKFEPSGISSSQDVQFIQTPDLTLENSWKRVLPNVVARRP